MMRAYRLSKTGEIHTYTRCGVCIALLLVLSAFAAYPEQSTHASALLRFDIPHVPAAMEGTPLQAVEITYTSRRQGYQEAFIRISDGRSAKSMKMIPRLGTHSVYLYPDLLGFWPDDMEIDVPPGTEIISLSLLNQSSAEDPIPADIGTMLTYSPEYWRMENFEVFRWNLAPEVFVFVTRDYLGQARLFKRLAFFVEKPGFSGELHRNQAIAHLHGWNAHDYRAEDLARFFQKALEEKFELNPEEEILYRFLITNGVLRMNDGTILPGAGSVLSISFETPLALRTKFLIHEAFHGLFFTSPRFRIACLDSWRAISPREQEFWKTFFSHRTYNVDNEFLLVNEFMAYLMQQKKEDLDWYFKDFIAQELISAYPRKAEYFREFYRDYPDTFLLSAARIEKAAEALFGVRAGDLACLVYNP